MHGEYWQGLIKMGLTKLYMLRALLEEPLHGYDLARRAADLSGGACAPTPGTIYPVLKEWEAQGLVDGAWETVHGRRRRIYRLTERGRDAFDAAYSAWLPAARAVVRMPMPVTNRLEDHLL